MAEAAFHIEEFSARECEAALRGERVPRALGLPVTQLCLIRGIRHHPGFASELHGIRPSITRALNARSIMSNEVPDIRKAEDIPYCIWHPDVASKATYREVARRYPEMRYQVGRACAIGGYTDLYEELHLLPEVHIAEEARDNGSNDIFDTIMTSAVKYAVMNDYSRTCNMENPPLARLNGDTAVKSLLLYTQKYKSPQDLFGLLTDGFETNYFNITEDMAIDDHDLEIPIPREAVQWLYNPLPADLPTVHKDLLILAAAHEGNIDRYFRLRRPTMIRNELNCVIRGIYNNTKFAKWWSLQDLSQQSYHIKKAIHARFIMNNDLSRINAETSATDLPYCIWYPSVASPAIYEELARRRPEMKLAAARACIVGDYEAAFDTLNCEPSDVLIEEARASSNPHYLRDLETKAATVEVKQEAVVDPWKRNTRNYLYEPVSTWLIDPVGAEHVNTGFDWIYNGINADLSTIELNLSVSQEMRSQATAESYDVTSAFVKCNNAE